MKLLLLIPLFLLSCVPSSQTYRPKDLNYDQQQQYDHDSQLVEEEFRRRKAEEFDSQTRKDIDRAVEKNR